MKTLRLLFLFLLAWMASQGHTRQDTLRGSNGLGRAFWDVLRYDLTVSIDTATREIAGENIITFRSTAPDMDELQIDLQEGMEIVGATLGGPTHARKDGNTWWIRPAYKWEGMHYPPGIYQAILSFKGKPRVARMPPWDGGFVWGNDGAGIPWVAVACQGLGASAWWPCKDYQGDEPDSGMTLRFAPVESLQLVSNGREQKGLSDTVERPNPVTGNIEQKVTHSNDVRWTVRNPINTYDATFYLGDYVSWTDTFQGAKGILPLSFYCLRHNEAKARKQFAVAKDMLRCFEWWLGPYPFYEDGYKLVEAPYLGMEHQSAVAYGNKYQMGYLGKDRSGTGVGLLFDYIIIHESGHEWFGNSITARDIADNWIHEGFTTYTETLYAEWIAGKDAARRYSLGERRNIGNDRPIIGAYGVNDEGSGDKYDKGAAVLHMIRTMLADDAAFRGILRGLNDTFYHKIVTTADVEAYIAHRAGRNLAPFFRQYLRTMQIPVLQWYRKGGMLYTRFANAVDGFTLPVQTEGKSRQVVPTGTAWSAVAWTGKKPQFAADYLLTVEEVKAR